MGSTKFDDSGVMDLTKNIVIMLFLGLFMIITFLVFFHFYAKRRGLQPIHDTNNRAQNQQQQGLDPSFLRTIRVIQFDPKEFKQGLECAVCLSEVQQGELARILPKCDHGFHVQCIDMWLDSHSTCPICRNPIKESKIGQDLREEFTNVSVEIDQGLSSDQASSSSLASQRRDTNRERPDLVIDIPTRESVVQEDGKTPASCSGIRSLRRMLSNSARLNPFSPGS